MRSWKRVQVFRNPFVSISTTLVALLSVSLQLLQAELPTWSLVGAWAVSAVVGMTLLVALRPWKRALSGMQALWARVRAFLLWRRLQPQFCSMVDALSWLFQSHHRGSLLEQPGRPGDKTWFYFADTLGTQQRGLLRRLGSRLSLGEGREILSEAWDWLHDVQAALELKGPCTSDYPTQLYWNDTISEARRLFKAAASAGVAEFRGHLRFFPHSVATEQAGSTVSNQD